MAFDPDAYLRSIKPSAQSFDPDAYLSAIGGAPKEKEEPGFLERVTGFTPGQLAEAAVPEFDLVKRGVASAIQGVAGAPAGAEAALRGVGRRVATGEVGEDLELYQLGKRLFGSEPTQEDIQAAKKRKSDVDRFINENIPNVPGLQELAEGGRDVANFIRERQSPEALQATRDSEIEGNLLEAVQTRDFSKLSFGKNPTLFGYALQGADVLGSLFPVLAASGLGAVGAGAVGGSMAAGEAAENAKEFVNGKSDLELSAASPYYKDLRASGISEKQAKEIIGDRAAESAAFLQGSVATLGGAATQKIVSGALDKTLGAVGRRRLGAIAVGGAAAAAEEGTQEFLEGIAADIGINTEVIKEIGEDSFANLVLGMMGGAPVGAIRGAAVPLPPRETPPETPPPVEPTITEPSPEPVSGPTVTPVTVSEPDVTSPVTPVTPPITPPVEPVVEPVVEPTVTAEPVTPPVQPVTPPVTPPTVQLTEEERAALSNYTAPGPEFQGAVLQNRDRSSVGAIDQMQKIAAKPNYRLVSQSNTLAEGAPVVVADLELSPAQLGRVDTATASNGQRFPVQYAVVSAGSLAPSNFADGTVNPIYQNLNQPAIRPVAGNGRVAGLQRAYSQGNAAQYQADLSQDTNHGISPEVISQIQDPVLVRILPKSVVPANIGDISNVSGVTQLTPVERAKNDLSRLAGRFDLSGLEFTADGMPTSNTLRQFVQAMPEAERGSLINAKTGEPNPDAQERLRNAIFFGAYQNEGLIDLYAATVDPDAKMYLNALGRVAPSMVRLANADPAYDVRPQVMSAVEDLVNAIRSGTKVKDLSEFIKQIPIDADPNTRKVLEFIVNSGRSSTRIAEGLTRLADNAYNLSQVSQEPDLFGQVPPKPPVDAAFDALLDEGIDPISQPVEPPVEPTKPTEPEIPISQEPPAYVLPQPLSQTRQELKDIEGDMIKLAEWAVGKAPNPLVKAVAEKVASRIKEFKKAGVRLEFKIQRFNRDTGSIRGAVRPSYGVVGKVTNARFALRLNDFTKATEESQTGLRYQTVLHELLHVATLAQLVSYSAKSPAVQELASLFKTVRARMRQDLRNGSNHPAIVKMRNGANIAQDIDELVTWGFTDGDMQDYLTTIRLQNQNGFSKFVDIVRKMFGLSKTTETALEQFVRVGETILDAPLQEIKDNLAALGRAQLVGGFNPQKTEAANIKNAKEVEKVIEDADEFIAAPIKFNRINIFGQPAPKPTWGRLDGSKMDTAIYVIADKMIDTKRVLERIQQAGNQIEDRWNAYLQEELYHGRTAKFSEDFLNDELAPLLRDMKDRGVSIVELEEYLHNRHAEERNNQVAKVNPGMQDGGSGILTADAQAYLANLTPQQRTDFTALAAQVDAMTKKNRDLLVQSGLETQETVDNWENAYKNYIPLARAEADYEMKNIGKGVGQGFSVKGPASRRAIGSTRDVIDILANVAMQRERTIVRAQKLRVGQAIYGMAMKYPNTDFYMVVDPDALVDPQQTLQDLINMGLDPADAQSIVQEPTQSRVNPITGKVETYVNPLLRGADNVLPVRINGRERYVFFNTNNERAVRMVTALKNLDADQLSRAVSYVQKVTRYFAAINTQYNPIFGVVNFTRDVQGGMIQLTDTPLAGEQKAVLAGTLPALRGIYAALRSRRKGQGPARGLWPDLWEEFQREGGQTGFRQQFAQSEERQEAIARELKKLSEGKAKKGARAILDILTDYNTTMENAVRLAAYKVGLDKGMSKEQAASLAKNLTVNFNKKGQISNQMGAWYAFFNAAVRGTARMAQALRGPAGKRIFFGGLLIGSVQALMLALAGFDEDEPPDFIKDRNFVIPLSNGKYITIPMPLGYNVIPATSRIITEWALSGGRDTPKRVAHFFELFLDAFNPVGNAGFSMQTFAPTVFDPGVAIFENRDWTGKPIAKKDLSSIDPTPGYTRAKETASTFSKYLSEFLNLATGGTDYKPGEISPTPDQIDYLIGQITGGVGREIMKAEQTVTAGITGEELPPYKIPLVGRFYGDTTSQAAQRSKFYDNMIELNKHENEIKGRRKDRKNVGEYTRENPEAMLFGVANNVERQVRSLRKQRERLLEKDAPREDVQKIEKRITDVMVKFNDRYEKAQER
jgi:hypothetical protein